jgi:predicted homoserine dehydrogenase-like protein
MLLSKRLQKSLKRKSSRKRWIRYGLIGANVVGLGIVLAVVTGSSHDSHMSAASVLAESSSSAAAPVDGLTSYDIASNVARINRAQEQR